mmetsp:Transcript_9575/g.25929  ORF Transcript_9575/g.25929 Transcript_9575/m.25929 type:complete len:91 (-) Transcript_9575:79-351(-)
MLVAVLHFCLVGVPQVPEGTCGDGGQRLFARMNACMNACMTVLHSCRLMLKVIRVSSGLQLRESARDDLQVSTWRLWSLIVLLQKAWTTP